ncbi:hypothetical protein jhhlp_002318 [Lomentospora prolificans]|uniref:Major facilitator superfamily (MFS) profile domain-containing protein n=1 Tax=Lomentospora prolificans TaxID=41688 RepID=A0A2N3NDQ6_9PEZI|nr:hypothetical protein jhhlp_002318 [Lomentospora prolificans]
MAKWRGHPSVRGSSEMMRMILLCFSAIGITFTWGFEMTYCTPYLLNLGLTKSNTSLVWIAGPISGLIVQPIVGAIADQSTSRWGRRRPLMVIGSVITAFHLFLLGFTREIVGVFLPESEFASRLTMWLAVYSIWVIDFAINASMSCSRSLVVDILPIHKQQAGAAWYSRLAAFGHLLSYGTGSVDLVTTFGTRFGDSQFKLLALFSIFAVLSTCALTCWAVTEKVLLAHGRKEKVWRQRSELFGIRSYIYRLGCEPSAGRISGPGSASWFPFNFYGTTWVGETYFRYDLSPEERKSRDPLSEIGRIGSSALVIYSLITFAGSFLLPLFVSSPEDTEFTHRPPRAIASALNRLEALKPDLLTAWILGHLGFSAAMSMAPFATSYKFATVLVASCGIPWAMTQWAPPTFLGIEVNRLSGESDTLPTTYQPVSSPSPVPSQGTLSVPQAPSVTRPSLSALSSPEATSLNPSHANSYSSSSSSASAPPTSASGELSGIYFGILNIYTTIPQFMGAVMSGIVFSILEPGKSPELAEGTGKEPSMDGPNAISVCLFIGAMTTLVSAYMTTRLRYIQ